MATRKRKKSKVKRKRKAVASRKRKSTKRSQAAKRAWAKRRRKSGGAKKAVGHAKHRGRKSRKKRKVHPNAIAALARWNARRAGKKLFAGMSAAERAKHRHARKHSRKRAAAAHVPVATSAFTPHQSSYLAELRAKAAARKAASASQYAGMAL